MKLSKSKDHNPNYLASVVEITEFRPHPNADRLKMASIFGNNVITGIDAEPGIYVYFPLECAISEEFLSFTNSFREPERNADKKSKGFFENHSRVRCIKLRGEPSEGYIVPAKKLEEFSESVLGKKIQISDKVDFDEIFGHQICRKYISRKANQGSLSQKTKGNTKKYQSKLVEGQFAFHQDTENLKRQIGEIQADDYISITEKYHGCNFIVSNVLCKRKLSLRDKIAKFFGVKIQENEYGMLYSSRSVIKNLKMDDGHNPSGFYDADVWKIVADKVFPSLSQGISVTGEIVGFTPTGSAIQRGYDYGCQPGELDFYIFKVTYTSPCGKVHTFGHRETVEFCQKFGFKMPKTLYYGRAGHLFREWIDPNWTGDWHKDFLDGLIDKYLEKKCSLCKNDVWEEGIVLRKEIPFEWKAFKLKSTNFLLGETVMLDSGEVDLETQESNGE